MNTILLRTINDRAAKSFDGDITKKENWDRWLEHWFTTAEQLRQELVTEGLVSSAEAVTNIVAIQRRLGPRVLA